ncbi:hypothetical protein [Sulfurirhabdus autotrophica]|uniref:Uncharacterized protein n=1 Tax=Sulfurirhabdus autotrophica TaxID=1706046 RepID=A0A4R3YCE5_9PROT|nr:hypothetical protein [Sulfurirhabdus autotrophica]TCV89660.1 hypothetical protein EDC63_102180 [Sulfurirhabdus autotrophica]
MILICTHCYLSPSSGDKSGKIPAQETMVVCDLKLAVLPKPVAAVSDETSQRCISCGQEVFLGRHQSTWYKR